MANLWDNDEPVLSLGIDVPRWIDQDITPCDVASICHGGCASGAYMDAVTYHIALKTMDDHGDDIFEYIEDCYVELPQPTRDYQSWAGMACFYVSIAVELWASCVEDEISGKIDELVADDE